MVATCYRFGAFRLRPATRELWKDGRRVALAPKSFDCLAYLVECRDRAVSRDELISAVWGRAEVSDALLAQTLWRARRVIGDTGREQAALRTVPRFGYQWVAPVTIEDDCAATDPARPRRRRFALPLAAASLAALALWAAFALRAPAQDRPASAHGLVLVLPAEVAEPTPDNAWLRLGAMDYIASHLRDGADMDVMPSEQVVALLRHRAPAQRGNPGDLARTLGAEAVLGAHIAQVAQGWHVELDIHRAGALRSVQASAATPLEAAAIATGRFLESMGRHDRLAASGDDRLPRIDAAMLAGDLAAARELVESAPASLKHDPALSIRAARIAFRAGRTDDAERIFRDLENAAAVDDAVRAQAELGLGAVALRRRAYADAERAYSRALARVGESGPTRLLARGHLERGIARSGLKQYDGAMDDYGRARVELERLHDRLGLAGLDTNIAILAGDRARWTDALAAYDRAIGAFAEFDVRDSLAITLADKVGAELALLDTPAALADSARAWNVGKDLENRIVVNLVATRRVDALMAAGQLAAAERVIDRFIDAPDAAPDFRLLRASLLVEQGRPDEALAFGDGILGAIEHAHPDASCPATLSSAALVLVDAAVLSGRNDTAAELLARIRGLGKESSEGRAFALELAEAKVLAAAGDAAASTHFANALAMADRFGRPDTIVAAGVAYARYLLAYPDRDRRLALLGRLAQYAQKDYRAAEATAALYASLGDRALAQLAGERARTLAGERAPLVPM